MAIKVIEEIISGYQSIDCVLILFSKKETGGLRGKCVYFSVFYLLVQIKLSKTEQTLLF